MATKLLMTALSVFTAVTAHPAIARAPCLSSDFSLAMRNGVGTDYVSLNAVSNGTESTLFLVAGPPSNEPGTPVALSGDSGSATIDVKLDGSSYGIYVPDLGELYGTAVPVTAAEGTDWPHFYYGDNEIDPQRTAASQDWYACNETISGETQLALSWGVYNSNGSSPWGCYQTRVIQIYNIPCDRG